MERQHVDKWMGVDYILCCRRKMTTERRAVMKIASSWKATKIDPWQVEVVHVTYTRRRYTLDWAGARMKSS